MRRISESLSVLIIVIILLFGYFFLEENLLLSLKRIRVIQSDNTPHNWEVLTNNYTYAANNIFDKGYAREIGPEIHSRLFIYPEETPLNNGLIIVPNNYERIVKVVLPKGFKDGVLELRITANSTFKIGISYDLKKWEFSDYPAFFMSARYDLNFEKENLFGEYIYLKFIPSQNENLSVYFDVFQYTSNLAKDKNETEGIFFYPETDIDFEGKKIDRPMIYFRK